MLTESTDTPARPNATPILFLHANGFPTGVYRQFLEVLRARRHVIAPQIVETPAAMRASHRWPRMTDHVHDLIATAKADFGSVVLAGHSMGGYLSLMAGARQPHAVEAIVLLDSPLVSGWRGQLFGVMRATGLTRQGGPAPIAARRRYQWDSSEQAREHFEAKSFAKRWAPGVLDDFVAHGLNADPEGRVSLRIAREAERDIYANLPAARALRAFHRLRDAGVPVHMIAGKHSAETDMAGREANRRLFGQRWQELDAGHLVPMERPKQCAAALLGCLA